MRLLDLAAAQSEPLQVRLRGGVFELPSAQLIAGEIRKAPLRYVLDAAVSAFVTRMALQDTARIVACLDLIRLPAPLLWIEWCELSRRQTLHELGLGPLAAPRFKAERAGLLIHGEDSTRAGSIDIVWSNAHGEVDLAPLRARFDLDDGGFAARRLAHARGALAPGAPDLNALFSHARFEMRTEWQPYYARTTATMDQIWTQNLAMIGADFPILCAFLLTLTAKNALSFTPIDRSTLNRSRLRQHKAALLDHIEVFARIGPNSKTFGAGDAARARARLHFVSGHLVRRAARLFWRRAHMRGDASAGRVQSRTVHFRQRTPSRHGES